MLPLLKRFIKPGSSNKGANAARPDSETASFYQLTGQLATGHDFPFADLRGRQVLLVNTPPDAAGSPQYQELQQLAAQFATELVVLVFPSTDFAEPAPAAAAAAAPSAFPAIAVAPIMQMQPSGVVKSARQNPVYRWLSMARQNGWNAQAPPAPFTKYLVNAAGQLAHYFGPTLSPLSEKVIDSIQEAVSG